MEGIILFDGECNLCNQSVQFIIKRDPVGHFRFTSLQSSTAKKLLRQHNLQADLNSFVLLEGNKCYDRSSAALRVCKHIKGGWKLLYLLILIPKPLRDFVYKIIAKNRYKWFGKRDRCMLPTPEIKKRFI